MSHIIYDGELYHYGVKGMRWQYRHKRIKSAEDYISYRNYIRRRKSSGVYPSMINKKPSTQLTKEVMFATKIGIPSKKPSTQLTKEAKLYTFTLGDINKKRFTKKSTLFTIESGKRKRK